MISPWLDSLEVDASDWLGSVREVVGELVSSVVDCPDRAVGVDVGVAVAVVEGASPKHAPWRHLSFWVAESPSSLQNQTLEQQIRPF
jgi:hypothetical protein